MANHVSHGSLPYPIKNARFTLLVPYLDADGDPTDPTTPDTELSGDAGSFADCAEEVSTITGSNGMGYLTLSGAEMNYSLVALAAKVASGPKATLATLYPRNLPTLSSGTLSAGSAGGGTLGTILAYDITGCFIRTTGGTGGGGTGGANNQARRIATYTPSTGAFTVTPNWETTPDNTTTYDILLPEGVTIGMLKTLNPTTAGRTLDVSSGGEAGVDWGNVGSPTTTLDLSGTTIKNVTDVATNITTILSRIGAFTGSGVNTILGFFRALMRKDGGITTPSDVGGTYDHSTDSAEANRDNLGSASAIGGGDPTIASNLVIMAGSGFNANFASLQAFYGLVKAFFQLSLRNDSAIATDLSDQLLILNEDYGSGAGDYDNTGESSQAHAASLAAYAASLAAQINDLIFSSILLETTVSAATSNTVFELTAGSALDDVYNDHFVVLQQVGTPANRMTGRILAYAGATREVTLHSDPGLYTVSIGDTVYILSRKVTMVADSIGATGQAEIEAIVDGLIQSYRLHEVLAAALASAPVAGSLFGDLTEDDAGTQRFTTNALEQAPTGGGLDAAGVRAAVGLAAANLDTQLAAMPTAGENADAVWDEARSGHTTSGTFGESFNGVVSGAAVTGTLSTTEMTTNLTEATDDHFIGRIIVWITGALAGQATDVTDYVGSTKKLVFTAVTDTPGNGDRFVIV